MTMVKLIGVAISAMVAVVLKRSKPFAMLMLNMYGARKVIANGNSANNRRRSTAGAMR